VVIERRDGKPIHYEIDVIANLQLAAFFGSIA
jgi:hypothetical protein